ncbi:MAG: hypothetical protein ACTSUQ_13670 [Candidatus Freyarchaeota archaeon]
MNIQVPNTGPGNWIWVNVNLTSPLLLNINETENNTFFISLKKSADVFNINWGCVNGGVQGYAYDILNQGVDVTSIGAILIDTLTLNVTLSQSVSGGCANLSIYDSPTTIKFDDTASGISGSYFVFNVDVNTNLTSAGSYNITVFFNTSLEVGYGRLDGFQVYSKGSTVLSIVDYDDWAGFSDVVNVTVCFERTDIHAGVKGVANYIGVSGDANLVSVVERGSGVYVVRVNFTSEGYHTFGVDCSGSHLL